MTPSQVAFFMRLHVDSGKRDSASASGPCGDVHRIHRQQVLLEVSSGRLGKGGLFGILGCWRDPSSRAAWPSTRAFAESLIFVGLLWTLPPGPALLCCARTLSLSLCISSQIPSLYPFTFGFQFFLSSH